MLGIPYMRRPVAITLRPSLPWKRDGCDCAVACLTRETAHEFDMAVQPRSMVLYQGHLPLETFLLSDDEAQNYDTTWKARVSHIHSACINHIPPSTHHTTLPARPNSPDQIVVPLNIVKGEAFKKIVRE